jgi:hypothetical protein
MKKICLLLVFCLLLSMCPVFAEETTDAYALLEQAQAALATGDYQTAVPLIRKAADLGDATAQLWLGDVCAYGIGAEQNDEEAVKYYQLAADQGNITAKYRLALCYLEGRGAEKDTGKAEELLTPCADQGNAESQSLLGYCYLGQYGMK